MMWLLIAALIIRLAAVGWSMVLLNRLRDWRLGILALLPVLMVLLLVLAWLGMDEDTAPPMFVNHALVISLIVLFAVVGLGEILQERKRLFRELRLSAERYRALAESAQDVIFVIGSDDRVQYVNHAGARQLGRAPDAVIGKARSELFPPEVATSQGISLRTVFETKQPATFENRIIYPDGERWLNTLLVPLPSQNGQVSAVLGVSRDITARRQVEQELRASRQRLATLSRQLISAQETERRRLAHELHDEIGQVLTAVHISLQAVRSGCSPELAARLDESDSIINRAIGQIRDMSLNLRPAMLDDFGLAAALRWFLERPERGHDLQIHFRSNATGLYLPTELKNSCFRIVQEAVTNVQRHAQARNLWVEVEETEHEITLCIRDDGSGFDASKAQAQVLNGKSFGLLGMQERVELHDGKFHLDSSPGTGTTLRVRLPIAAEQPS